MWCILGEAALRSGVGGAAVMREQLEHLITMTTLLRAKALGHEDSGEFIQAILSELEER